MSAQHLAILQHSIDPIIFFRVVRAVLLVIAAVIMLFEPMSCGGKNRVFHRLLSGFMLAGSWSSWTQAKARMALVMADPKHFFSIAPTGELFWPELAFTTFTIMVAGRLVYDVYVYRRLKKFGVQQDCGRICEAMPGMRPIRGGTK